MRNTSPFNGRSKPHIMARKIFTASIWDDPGKECQYAPLARRENDLRLESLKVRTAWWMSLLTTRA